MVRETVTIIKGDEAIEKLSNGSRQTASAVSTTYGPYGRNVAITKFFNAPHITKDGATVAKELHLMDPAENVAAQTINEAANKTAMVAGDGTTSTTILANELVQQAFSIIKQTSSLTNTLKRELEEATELVLKEVKMKSTAVEGELTLKHIAMVSSNHDEALSNLVVDAFTKIGSEGVVSVVDSKSYKTFVDTTDGIKLDRSHISPTLVGDKEKSTYSDCHVLVTNLNIKTSQEALELVNLQETTGKPLLVICNDIEGPGLETIAHNKLRRGVPIIIIRAPFMAEARFEACRDLSIATGAVYLEKESGWTLHDISPKVLGTCDNVEISSKETNIIGRHGDPKAIEERVRYYQDKIDLDVQGLSENYKKRLGMLTSGAAVIYVGGSNEIEVREKKDRLDDTIRAVKAALEEGYVLGGGITYNAVKDVIPKTIGGKMLYSALSSLTNTLLSNGDIEPSMDNILEFYEEVKREKIIDPTLVVTSTIKNAVGAAIMIFTTNCIVIKNETHDN